MSALHNKRHEAFAFALSSGRGVKESYIAAGYKQNKTASHCASRLKGDPLVEARTNELIAERLDYHRTAFASPEEVDMVAEFHRTGNLSKDWVLAQLMKNGIEAARLNQIGASNQAWALIGKALGLFDKNADRKAPILHDEGDRVFASTQEINLFLKHLNEK